MQAHKVEEEQQQSGCKQAATDSFQHSTHSDADGSGRVRVLIIRGKFSCNNGVPRNSLELLRIDNAQKAWCPVPGISGGGQLLGLGACHWRQDMRYLNSQITKVMPRISAQSNTGGNHRVLIKNSKLTGSGGVGRCLGGIGYPAALMRLLDFLLVQGTRPSLISQRRAFSSCEPLMLVGRC